MKHRHLDVESGTPAEDLPAAALVDLLERGDIGDWKPIAAAVVRDPGGAVADRVLRIVNAYPMYGTSALWRAWIARRRDMAEGSHAADAAPATFRTLRRRRGLTQVELAARMEISQSDLSKLERRRDLRLSTLQSFAVALGARLRTLLRYPDGSEHEVRLEERDRRKKEA